MRTSPNPDNMINLTAVAKMLHASTPNARKKLTSWGLTPLIEIPMPSGRVYQVFDRTRVEKALAKHKGAPKAAPEPTQTDTQDQTAEELRASIKRLEATVQQLLEVVTKPKQTRKPRAPKAATKETVEA